MNQDIGRLTLICLPGTMLGPWLVVKTPGRVDHAQFRAIVLWLLFVSAAVMTATNLLQSPLHPSRTMGKRRSGVARRVRLPVLGTCIGRLRVARMDDPP